MANKDFVFLVIAFLHLLKNSVVRYSQLNTACSSLSFFFLAIEDHEAGKHSLVLKYLKGSFNENPSIIMKPINAIIS